MSATIERRIAEILTANEREILSDWLLRQRGEGRTRYDEAEARDKSTKFLTLFAAAVDHGDLDNMTGSEWRDLHVLLRFRELQYGGFVAMDL